MTKLGKEMLDFQEQLAKEYGYKPIEPNLFLGDVRDKYRDNLPSWCNIDGDKSAILKTEQGTCIARGYKRIVIGDYGAFLEITPEQICKQNVMVAPGQEYRIQDEQYRDHVKYYWYTAKDRSNAKLYFQQKTVAYADYVPGMWYISPYEVVLSEK